LLINFFSAIARITSLPILPNPFIPTLIAINISPLINCYF
jgi:hypothetical protein